MDFKYLEQFIDTISEKGIPCADCAVSYKGETVFRHSSGYRDLQNKKPIEGNELYFLYSASKVITVTAAMILFERGAFLLEDNLSDYISEFKDMKIKRMERNGSFSLVPATKPIKIRDLFTMSAGLTYNLSSPSILAVREKTDGRCPTVETVRAIANEPLMFEPGEHYNYSLCHDVLGAIIELVSGKTFGQYLKDNIFDPLGMENTGFFPTDEQLKRFAAQYRSENNEYKEVPVTCAYRLSKNYESGGAGLFSCTNDYVKFSDALANHGTAYNGYQVLRPETVELMRANQLDGYLGGNKPGYGYAFGVRTMLNTELAGSDAPCDSEFGWDGAAGAYVAIDPKHRLTVVYTQHVLSHGWVYTDVHPVLRDSAYYIAGIC